MIATVAVLGLPAAVAVAVCVGLISPFVQPKPETSED